MLQHLFNTSGSWLLSALSITLAVAAGLLLQWAVIRAVQTVLTRRFDPAAQAIRRRCAGGLRVLLPVLLVHLALPGAVGGPALPVLRHLLAIVLILAVGWLLGALLFVVEDVLVARLHLDARDNLHARKVYTQFRIMRRVAVAVIAVITLGMVLMSFERLRELGTGLLASAGVAGIIVGLAAQRTLANMFAGFQLALTQPIRIDDVVIVEGEWGWVEEFTLNYVVLRLWDLRRLVVPIGYFLDKPFQNWTRISADILGTVFLHVDYSVPVQAVRDELERILKTSTYWDGKVWRLHVTDAGEHTVELRALMSAADSPTAWELRCEVREKLLEFLQKNFPDGLPKTRAKLEAPALDPRPSP